MAGKQARATTIALLGVASGTTGYILEAVRQRGDCDRGNNSPDTLGLSLGLIFLGAGLIGLFTLAASVRVIRRDGFSAGWRALTASIVSIACVGPVFFFAGAGPGSWFQYCGT